MGQDQSRVYPEQPGLSEKNYKFEKDTPVIRTSSDIGLGDYSLNTLDLRKKQVGKLFDKLESNLKMYMLFDNYDTKNEAILIDLKKKSINQEEELKNLIESRDKLMAIYANKKDDNKEFDDDDKTYSIVNPVLFVILLAAIIFIIYKLYTYPVEDDSGINIDTLLDINNNKLNSLSTDELDNLDYIYEKKIKELERMVNQNNIPNNISNSSNSSGATSVNNITESNLKKINKRIL
jgi:hypothetical protein